jgi:hypothetical protein
MHSDPDQREELSQLFFLYDRSFPCVLRPTSYQVAKRREAFRCRYLRRNAQAHAKARGVSANTRFEVGLAKDYPGKDFDLVTCFDCLHDMGDPAGASAHIRQSLKSDGTWMIVEPMAGDTLKQNLNPVGRLYYAGSTMICLPTTIAGSRCGTWRAGR